MCARKKTPDGVSSWPKSFLLLWKEAYMEDPVPVKEEYTYQVGKIQFIVTPVYKDKGESMHDILLKLMLADLEPA